ncbi:MAG: VacJ family lipoprotein [Alphaproteobacteria bacterium]|nr:VacJ family lipoprotein [Alphaproteobacteria bacterium]
MLATACFDKLRAFQAVILVLAALSLVGCASQRTPEEIAHVQETNDPYEPFNRSVFAFNDALDVVILKPLAVWYRFLVPIPEVRDAITRVLDNASLPWTAANEVFQGEFGRARITTTRFLINTTLGIGGVFDWATRWGFPHHEEDFGLTLARTFGMREGPYLMLPLLGPSNVRDTGGRIVDGVGDPVGWILPFPGSIVRGAVRGIDTRQRNIENIDELRRDSVDFYATLRSVWRQRRESQVRRGEAPPSDIPRVTSDMGRFAPSVGAAPEAAPAAPASARPTAAPTARPAARPQASRQAPQQQQGAAAADLAPVVQTARAPWLLPRDAAPQAAPPAAPRATPEIRWFFDPARPQGQGQ